jgi:hypothetical protein
MQCSTGGTLRELCCSILAAERRLLWRRPQGGDCGVAQARMLFRVAREMQPAIIFIDDDILLTCP